MDPVLNSIVLKDQACEIENFKVDGVKSVDIICYGAMFSPYKSNLQREFSEEYRKFETQRKKSKRLF
ncbi:hypothetical protein HanPSC8_Chr14g0599051 [Helianthus annuus]|nr:hypothetical protein HanPSC8_Chr14g0599051 [Helianthus annuus]